MLLQVKLKTAMETDYSREVSKRYQLTYDTPNEADILIIFHMAEGKYSIKHVFQQICVLVYKDLSLTFSKYY